MIMKRRNKEKGERDIGIIMRMEQNVENSTCAILVELRHSWPPIHKLCKMVGCMFASHLSPIMMEASAWPSRALGQRCMYWVI